MSCPIPLGSFCSVKLLTTKRKGARVLCFINVKEFIFIEVNYGLGSDEVFILTSHKVVELIIAKRIEMFSPRSCL